MFKCLQIMCAKYYEHRYMCYKKKLHLVKIGAFDTASTFALFSASRLNDEQLIKKHTYMKTETSKLYSTVF